MATLTTVAPSAVPVSVAKALPLRRRRVTPERGRALEQLSHAIEYLMDEHLHEGRSVHITSDRTDAMQLLLHLRRQVYTEAPEVEPAESRLRLWVTQLLA